MQTDFYEKTRRKLLKIQYINSYLVLLAYRYIWCEDETLIPPFLPVIV